jgi:3-isopropylmalate/(R)-2-methylmalate dehydratase small subunit
MSDKIQGRVYVVGDNIDTDQIIPAQYLSLVPTIPEEYEKLGSYALCGLPDDYPTRFVAAGQTKSEFRIIVAGRNFGCGSSREHAPVSLGAAGARVVIAESFARIFFRNCIATGELYPVDVGERLCDRVVTGEEAVVDLAAKTLTLTASGRVVTLCDLGDAKAVIDHGGLFEYARKTGMIRQAGGAAG